MLSLPVLALGLGLFIPNIAALPATDVILEDRQTASMSDTINSYITGLKQAGFIPNGKPTAKREESAFDLSALVERATAPTSNLPKIVTVLALLKSKGFLPATSTVHARDEFSDSISGNLTKRALPDINLIISLLKKQGFLPSGTKQTRDLETRDGASDVSTVINQLVNAGYNPSDFGPNAHSSVQAITQSTLPLEITAQCPKDNNTLYATGGQTYAINCQWDFPGSDLSLIQTPTLAACLASCSITKGCVAASWGLSGSTGNCFLKSAVTHNNRNSLMSAGRNVKNTY